MLANANPIKQISHRARDTYDRDDDIYAAICHSERVVRGAEQLLRRRVAHYGHKMMVKERPADFVSREGPTAWQWHQVRAPGLCLSLLANDAHLWPS